MPPTTRLAENTFRNPEIQPSRKRHARSYMDSSPTRRRKQCPSELKSKGGSASALAGKIEECTDPEQNTQPKAYQLLWLPKTLGEGWAGILTPTTGTEPEEHTLHLPLDCNDEPGTSNGVGNDTLRAQASAPPDPAPAMRGQTVPAMFAVRRQSVEIAWRSPARRLHAHRPSTPS